MKKRKVNFAKALMFLCCMIAFSNAYSNYSWKQKSNFGSTGRTTPGYFEINGKGYLGCGYDMTANKKDFWEYNPSTDVWTQKADFGGLGRQGPASFAVGGKGYIGMGSTTYPIYTFVNDWWEYDPTLNTWTQKGNFPGAPRYTPLSFTIGNKGYMGTGWDQFVTPWFRDFWEYDPALDAWTQKANFGGTARQSMMGFSVNGKGYAGTGWGGSSTSDFWEYDPTTNTWSPKANFPAPARYGAAAFVMNGEAYAGLGTNGSVFYTDFYKFDPVGNTWTPIAAFPGAGRNSPGSFAIGQNGYVATGAVSGGVTNTVYEYSNDVLVITPSQTNVLCFGESTGEASVVVSGGVEPYSYLWSPNGETTDAITGLAAGNYSVTVTDANGTSGTQNFEITEPASSVSVSISGSLSFCNGGSTTLTANASGGTGSNYGYSWSSGESTQSISASVATSYSVTVTDENGCTATDQETVIEGNGPTCSISGNLTVCQGGSTEICAPAGLASYLWSTGETTACISVGDGNYSVTISDQSGCSSSCNETVTTTNESSCSITGNTSVCTGGTTSLCASAGASYIWNTGATTQCINAGVGNYSVTVTDNGGCTSTCTASVTDNGGGNCCSGFRTQTQGAWGALCKGGNSACYMVSHFAAAFSSPNYLTVGCGGGFTLKLTTAQAVIDFLPSGGTARALTANLVNPGGTYSNVLAGQLVAATLNVQFDLIDPNFSAASSNLGSLVILSGTFTGMTVSQVIAEANNVLGGCPSQYTASQLNAVLTAINQNYDNGTIDLAFLGCNGASARFINGHLEESISSLETLVYPNPFYEKTNIHIMARENGNVKLEVFNVSGKLIDVLFDGQMNAGDSRELEFNGSEMTDAVYYYRITSGSQILNGRLILVR